MARVVNGTSYSDDTPEELVALLEKLRADRTRVHVSYGHTEPGHPKLGLDWLEEHNVTGYVSRSMGEERIPLLVYNRRSRFSPGILDGAIVRIRVAAGGKVLYQHPNYTAGVFSIGCDDPTTLEDGRVLQAAVYRDGQLQARFETVTQARNYCRKFGVESYPITAAAA